MIKLIVLATLITFSFSSFAAHTPKDLKSTGGCPTKPNDTK